MRLAIWAFEIVLGYFAFGFILLFLLVIACRLAPGRRWTGHRDIFNPKNTGFFLMSGALVIAEHFFLPMIKGTPFLNLFYRGLGAKIGRRTIIASLRLRDMDLLTIGEDCVIAGEVAINCHSAEMGKLIRGQVVIGDRVNIGQYTTVLAGVRIEDDVTVGANSLVPKDKILRSGKTYAGVPVREIRLAANGSSLARNAPAESEQLEVNPLIDETKSLDILLEAYKMKHNEVLAWEHHIFSVIAASVSALAALIVYSVINKPVLIAFLPMLVSLSGLAICALSVGINDLGFHMSKIEHIFMCAGSRHLDWERTEGAMGKPRGFRLPNVIGIFMYLSIFGGSVYLTFWGQLLSAQSEFIGFSVRKVCAILDIGLGTACMIVFIGVGFQNFSLRKKLRQYIATSSAA